MKKTKKLLSLVLVLALAMAMSMTAMAASIKIDNTKAGHTYEAYQVFTGKLEDGTLSDIKWGAGVDDTKLLTDLKNNEDIGTLFAECETAKDVAKVLDDNSETAKFAETFAKIAAECITTAAGSASTIPYEITGLTDGYYLIQDMNGSLDGDNDVYTNFILKVVGNETVKPKGEVPSVDKQVKDEDADGDKESGSADGWGETADHEFGESFQFKLKATLPADAERADYETYMVKFTDTMSAGVTYDSIESVIVKVGEGEAATTYDSLKEGTDYTVEGVAKGQAGKTWTLTIDDLKDIVDEDITEKIEIEVIYNAYLNENAVVGNHDDNQNTVNLDFSNNPNGEGTGKAIPDTVYVFTYEIPNKKVDGSDNNKPMEGAGFKLQNKATGKWAKFDQSGKLSGWADTMDDGSQILSGEDGTFKFSGLDIGEYLMTETKVPKGYNKCEDMTVTITATHQEEGTEGATAKSEIEMTLKVGEDGTPGPSELNTIVNNKGSELPSTGGIGTTIFYVIGGILVIGAAILLISRRRTDAE